MQRRLTTWFLDRDGVINRQVVGDYVRSWAEFEFLPGALDALRVLADHADHIVVVTNQQGVGRGLMSPADVADIHDRMRRAVAAYGGRIDEVLFCPHLSASGCVCRKPQPGLVDGWLAAHPAVDAADCVVVGDSGTDIEMGRRAGAGDDVLCVRVVDPAQRPSSPPSDLEVSGLGELALLLERTLEVTR